jgi:hypothetical protein
MGMLHRGPCESRSSFRSIRRTKALDKIGGQRRRGQMSLAISLGKFLALLRHNDIPGLKPARSIHYLRNHRSLPPK